MSGLSYLMGGGHVAGEDLAGVVIQCRHRHRPRVHLTAEIAVLDDGQGVSQDGHLVGVLLDILRLGVAHEPPSG